MSPVETMMWRADPTVPCPVVAIEVLDTLPEWDRLRAVHERAVGMLPRLRERVVQAPFGLGAPCWSADPHFDLDWHLWRIGLADGQGWPQLLEGVAHWAREPFERSRPLWEAVLCEGLPDGHAAYLLKLHHSVADGLGTAQLLEHLHTSTGDARPDPRRGLTVTAAQTNGLDALVGQLREDVTSAAGMVTRAGTNAWAMVRDPAGWVSQTTRYGCSLSRTLRPPAVEASPLLARRGTAWRFATLDVELPGLRAAAKTAGATLNDAYLAALLGGYRRYHTTLGVAIEAIPMAIPISRRRPGDPGGGNRITGARLSGSTNITDPQTRIQAIRQLTLAARAEPALDGITALAPILARLPGPVIARLIRPATAGNDLQAGLLPGPRGPRYLAGAHVQRIYPFAPLPGCPAMITMVTHRDTGCIGINYDPAAITEPDLFLDCLSDGFTEVASPHTTHPAASTPT